ncbi:D-erythronate dehydrogenase [Pollutimonas harenae]|uniref:SDR family oxidoreductase n=1 Tax=Pollutimonas harenae TaxID=657015 RepID=A0A853H2C3_9BURK|nr:D-erythronate dehydrogenase [Pollutimonas harenae]NYT85385.1 SDR family oxidoreductase [Pollutimonas harenae]TEA70484.1 SDR family oxidoreductase [Pollutimonas harenae]
MHIAITGAAGFLGNKLARQLLKNGKLLGRSGKPEAISRITLADVTAVTGISDPRVHTVVGNISDPQTIASIVTPDTDSIFHLAAIVSGQAEAEFDLGMTVNFDATRSMLERIRSLETRPRMVFTSSVAVFGGPLPTSVPDTMATLPQSSYGTQKAMCELLISDYSRRGYLDGRTLRLPTISVRPGLPNKAASSFASGIIREPLAGQAAVCPVHGDTRMWLMSPQQAVNNLIHGHELEASKFGFTRTISLPGLSVKVRDMVAALERVAGVDVAQRIEWTEDEAIKRIVNSWPGDFDTQRATELGFTSDEDYDSIIRAYIHDQQTS